MPFCHDVTTKSIEILGNCSGSADKGCDLNILISRWILHQPMHNSFIWFVYKILKLHKNYCFKENHSGGLSVHSFGHKSSIGSKSLNLRKKAGVKSMTYFFKLNDLKETLATFL